MSVAEKTELEIPPAKGAKYAVAKQLLVEMWAPLALAVIWTAYNLYQDASLRNIKGSVTIFGPTFFLMCWAYSQWLRVRKQLRVEQGLVEIEGRLDKSIQNFNEKTAEVISKLTGGDGFCYVAVAKAPGTYFENATMLQADNNYTLFDLEVRVKEKDGRPHDWANPFAGVSTYKFAELKPNQAKMHRIDLKLEVPSSRKFFIDFFARNGRWRQELLIEFDSKNERLIATRVERDGKILHEQVDPDFPLNTAGRVDWIYKLPGDLRELASPRLVD
jgi:hypothetical protein